MRSLRALRRVRMNPLNRADRSHRHRAFRQAWGLWVALFALMLAGCGKPLHLTLDGPGLHRAVAQGGQSALHFWWLPPTAQAPTARLLLWDGANVGLSDPAAADQRFKSLTNGPNCAQVAVAPDDHAFACGLIGADAHMALVQSLIDVDHPPLALLDESAPVAWSPDSRFLTALRLGVSESGATCSVVRIDTSLPDLVEGAEQDLLDGIPLTTIKGASVCPVMALAWSPDGARLALSLAASRGVVLEVLALGAPDQPPTIESRYLLPGQPLQVVDTPAVPSLFWSSDGQLLAALTGYEASSEDGLFLFSLGQQAPLVGPNLIDSGSGAALAFSPDGRWLAVGAVGPTKGGDNAQLRVFDTQSRRWDALASMFVNGPTLAWSPDSALLAAASSAQQGEVIWNWPAFTLNSVLPNPTLADVEQLGWAQDTSALFFAMGSHSSAPFYDEVYVQSFPVPPGASSFAFPGWFLDALQILPQGLVWFGVTLGALMALTLALSLLDRGKSRRRRAFIGWTLGVCVVLFGLLLLSYDRLPGWLAGLYQPYSERVCQGAPIPCAPGALLVVGTLGGALLLGLLVIVSGALLTSRKGQPVPGEGLPRPVYRGPLREQPAQEEEPPALLPPPIDEQDTLELEALPLAPGKDVVVEMEEQDGQN
ncbi:MAG TPA: WD40 repeat domain-containing protein [Ktedonobacterales bacterium]|jgi:hypothetical protein